MKPVIAYRHLGRMGYAQALEVQREEFARMLAAKNDGHSDKTRAGTLFTVEHPAVYTLGKNGLAANLLVGEERLKAEGAEFYRTDRGGDITFHGEGQIVGYPVLDLEVTGTSLRDYVDTLEQAVIDTLLQYGIVSGRSEGASGVWLWEGCTAGQTAPRNQKMSRLRKICAIGVRASRYITMHGFALNVATDLRRFAMINPCGFTDRGVTSMQQELGTTPDIDEVRLAVVSHLINLLGAQQGA